MRRAAVFSFVLCFFLFVVCQATAKMAEFSIKQIHLQSDKTAIVNVYAENPDSGFANITVWLGGDYPSSLARFSSEGFGYFTADGRNVTLELNPKERKTLTLVVIPTAPRDTPYIISMTSNTTFSSSKDFDTLSVYVDYPPNFPGNDVFTIMVIISLSGFIYWRISHI